jgi:hypothetical protein
LEKLNQDELTIEAMNAALHLERKITISPAMFFPTLESTAHFKSMLKAQITHAILRYYAFSTDTRVQLQRNPPPVHPIEHYDPRIDMLKLMVASDNLAVGVSEVFMVPIQQSGLTPAQFHSQLQFLEGDLASCHIFSTLRQQRFPLVGNETSLDNVLPATAGPFGRE